MNTKKSGECIFFRIAFFCITLSLVNCSKDMDYQWVNSASEKDKIKFIFRVSQENDQIQLPLGVLSRLNLDYKRAIAGEDTSDQIQMIAQDVEWLEEKFGIFNVVLKDLDERQYGFVFVLDKALHCLLWQEGLEPVPGYSTSPFFDESGVTVVVESDSNDESLGFEWPSRVCVWAVYRGGASLVLEIVYDSNITAGGVSAASGRPNRNAVVMITGMNNFLCEIGIEEDDISCAYVRGNYDRSIMRIITPSKIVHH